MSPSFHLSAQRRRFAARRVVRGRMVACLAAAILVGVGLAGCDSDGSESSSSSGSSTSTSTTVKSDEQVFTQADGDLSVSPGETFVIALESNPSTGFVWTVAQAPDAAVVRLETQAYEKPDSSALGAPGTERFTFDAVATGTTTIVLRYARPSDPDSPDATTDTYAVTVG